MGPRPPWQDAPFLGTMVAILVFANWGASNQAVGFFAAVYRVHWPLTVALLGRSLLDDAPPLLLGGILVSGWLMGRPGHDAGLVPSSWVAGVVGGNSVGANLLASVVGAFMYFATLTEVPILQTLLGSGMGQGPALALLLAGPALSLPSMLVINSYLGPRKTHCLRLPGGYGHRDRVALRRLRGMRGGGRARRMLSAERSNSAPWSACSEPGVTTG